MDEQHMRNERELCTKCGDHCWNGSDELMARMRQHRMLGDKSQSCCAAIRQLII